MRWVFTTEVRNAICESAQVTLIGVYNGNMQVGDSHRGLYCETVAELN
jgi:hypothetical protein